MKPGPRYPDGKKPVFRRQGLGENKPPTIPWLFDWKERMYASLARYLGARAGLAVFLLGCLAIPFLWSNWKDIRQWSVVQKVETKLTQPPVPRVPADRYGVLVAKLHRDTTGKFETFVLESLAEVPGISVHQLGRPVLEGGAAYNHTQKDKADREARDYLRTSGAGILLWGTVLEIDGKSVVKLRWVTDEPVEARVDFGRYSATARNELPAGFWSDLSEVVQLLVANEAGEFAAHEGRFVADRLQPFVDKVKVLLHGPGESSRWSPAMRLRAQAVLADSLVTLGEQRGSNSQLEEAVAVYEQLLAAQDPVKVPLDWASTKNDLGHAMRLLGSRDAGAAWLELSVKAYHDALSKRPRESVPQDWAASKNGLGSALRTIGTRRKQPPLLEQAIDAYRESLQERKQEVVPLRWAATQNNLGNALRALGAQLNDPGHLARAIEAYKAALSQRPRALVPLDWAATQNNLGNALRTLGVLSRNESLLQNAVEAYEAALGERTREKVPLRWAATQHNLGLAFLGMNKLAKKPELLERAAISFERALSERTKDRTPQAWAASARRLSQVSKLLGRNTASAPADHDSASPAGLDDAE